MDSLSRESRRLHEAMKIRNDVNGLKKASYHELLRRILAPLLMALGDFVKTMKKTSLKFGLGMLFKNMSIDYLNFIIEISIRIIILFLFFIFSHYHLLVIVLGCDLLLK